MPASVSPALAEEAISIARRFLESLDYVGVLGVEFATNALDRLGRQREGLLGQNIDQIEDIIRMTIDLKADYVELASTQYYGWSKLNEAGLLPTREQLALDAPANISSLVTQWKGKSVKLVWMEPNRSRKTPEFVANAIGAKVVVLPILVGGAEKAADYFSLFDHNLTEISAAMK